MSADGCGAPAGGVALDDVDVSRQTVIQGVVTRGVAALAGAYVRLLDSGGEFVAEVPTSDRGEFRFFARPGRWTVRVVAPGVTADRTIEVSGQVTDVPLALPR